MLKKIGLICVLGSVAVSAMAATPKAVKQCNVTIAVSHYWSMYNITFENMNGTSMGFHNAGGNLIIYSQHPCKKRLLFIRANPTLGLPRVMSASGYESAIAYPMDGNIAISFPDDFPGAPLRPTDNV